MQMLTDYQIKHRAIKNGRARATLALGGVSAMAPKW